MSYPQFTLRQDWYLENEIAGQKLKQLLFNKGHKFLANEEGEYIIEGPFVGRLVLDTERMRLSNDRGVLLFDEEDPNFEIVIEEVTEDDDNLIGLWRIQLDVRTTRKKLKDVQKIIEEHVRPIVNG